MTIFRTNLSKGHKFIPSALLVGFSMARVLTCVLRIVWSKEKHNVSLAIAAQIFVAAGILIVYIINLIFAQRILRARRPEVGWHPVLRILFGVLYALVAVALILVITLTVLEFYTLDPKVHSDALWIQRGAILYLLIVAVLPLAMLSLTYILPRSPNAESFGRGSVDSKAVILLAGSCLCTIIAGFRAGTTWEKPRPANDPAWYDSKAAFYCFQFMCEIMILILYITTRVDQRFYVPDGSSKRKSYAVQERRGSEMESEKDGSELEKKDSGLS